MDDRVRTMVSVEAAEDADTVAAVVVVTAGVAVVPEVATVAVLIDD